MTSITQRAHRCHCNQVALECNPPLATVPPYEPRLSWTHPPIRGLQPRAGRSNSRVGTEQAPEAPDTGRLGAPKARRGHATETAKDSSMDTTLRIPPPHPHGGPAPVTRQPGQHRAAILACALLSLALGQAAKAAPGDLDPSFDADGLVLTHFGRSDDDSVGGRNDSASFVVVQPDGKIVVAGRSEASAVFLGGVVGLARYTRTEASMPASPVGGVFSPIRWRIRPFCGTASPGFRAPPRRQAGAYGTFSEMEIKS